MNNAKLARVQAVSLYEIDDPFDNDFARTYEAATAYLTGDES